MTAQDAVTILILIATGLCLAVWGIVAYVVLRIGYEALRRAKRT